jgi:hypothetical protein
MVSQSRFNFSIFLGKCARINNDSNYRNINNARFLGHIYTCTKHAFSFMINNLLNRKELCQLSKYMSCNLKKKRNYQFKNSSHFFKICSQRMSSRKRKPANNLKGLKPEFPENYPKGFPTCIHGPLVKYSSTDGKSVFCCSFDRNNSNCTSLNKIKKVPSQTSKIRKDWLSKFQTVGKNSTQAQYFFNDESKNVLVSLVDKQTVILVGCPTLMIPLLDEGKDVILLDIDERFFDIFPAKNFRKFNLVNGFFFDENELNKGTVQI